MSLGLEYLKNDAVAEPVVPTEGEFSKGLRSGAIGMESQLRSLAAGVGAAAGADEFARGQQAKAMELNQQAQAVAPRVGSYKDVGGLRDAWDYSTGLMGQALPSMVPAIAGGAVAALSRGRINPVAAAAAAYAPLETGDVLQRQQLDPVASQRTAGENLGAAALAGGISSIGQAIVPGMLGSRLAGGTVRAGLRPGGTLLGAVGRDAVTEGLSEAGGEALKQQGVELGRATDWDAVAAAGVGGAVVGGPLGGVGHAAERLHSVPGGLGNAVRDGAAAIRDKAVSAAQTVSDSTPQSVKDFGDRVNAGLKDATDGLTGSISERVAGAKEWHKELMDSPDVPAELKAQAQEMAQNFGNKANQAWLKAAAAAAKAKDTTAAELPTTLGDLRNSTVDDDTGDRLAAGTPLGDLKEYGARQGASLNDYVKENAKKAADWTVEQGNKLRDKLPQDKRDQLDSFLADAGSSASQAWVATQKKAVDTRDRVKRALDDINAELRSASEYDPNVVDAETKVKKSESLSGLYDAMAEQLAGKVDPAVLEDNDATNALAESLRKFVVAASREDFFEVQKLADGMRNVLGDNTDDVLTNIYATVGDNEPKRMERYFSNVGRLRAEMQKHKTLQGVIEGALDPALGFSAAKVTDVLKKWASGGDTAKLGPNTASFIHTGIRNEIDKMFGAKAPSVYEALQRHADETSVRTAMDASPSQEGDMDNVDEFGSSAPPGTSSINETTSGRQFFGGGKSAKAMDSMRDPVAYEAQWGKKDSSAHKLMEKLQTKYPGADVKFISEPEYNKEHGINEPGNPARGFVVVEGENDPTTLTDADVTAVRHDNKAHANSPAKLKVAEGVDVDAYQLTSTMLKKVKASESSDGVPSSIRAARAFMDGVAQLTERYGAFEVPDSTLISKGLTFGQAKAMRLENALDQESDALRARVEELRAEYHAAIKNGDEKTKAAAIKEARAIVKDMAFERDKELANDFEGRTNQVSLGQMLLEDQGRQASGPTDDIHTAAATQRPDEMVSRSNMDGSAKFVNDKNTKNTKPLILLASKLRDMDTAPAHKVAGRLEVLTKGIYSMREADQQRLLDATKLTKVSEVATVANELARKYKDVLVAPKGAVEAVKSYVADKSEQTAAVLDKALANEDYSAIKSAKDIPAFRKAVEARYEELRKLDGQGEGLTGEQESAYIQALRMVKDTNFDWNSLDPNFGMADEGVPPRPKAAAAKKAAFLEKAASGNKALIDELKASTDAKGLQRAAEALNNQELAGKQAEVLNAINERLDTLVQDPDVAYGLGTKKYSMSGTFKGDTEVDTDGSRYTVVGKVGPIPNAIVSSTIDGAGDVVMNVYDPRTGSATAPHEAIVLSFDLFKNNHGKWEVGVDGPALNTGAAHYYTGQFEEVTGSGGETTYTKFKPGVFAQTEIRKLLRTLRDEATALGVSPAEVSAIRETGVKAGREGATYSTARLKRMSAARSAGTAGMSPQARQQVQDAINKVLGNSVKVEFRNLPHAGEFETVGPDDVIRISTYALNPTSVAYHEALHAFFAKLARAKQTDISKVLEKAAASEHVRKQLDAFFANEPEVLKQINDNAEERAAYMYQLWAGGHITVAPPVASVFQRISNMLREVLGIWSNDQRALHIMEYFQRGDYAANMGNPNAVYRALMEPGRNAAFESFKTMARPLQELGDAVITTGSERLRDTGNAHLTEIADRIKLRGTDEGADQGYLPAARLERTARLNSAGAALERFTREQLNEALEALQTHTTAKSTEARSAAVTVKQVLRDTFNYMRKAGVNIADRGVDHFPRVWDSHYISQHQTEFLSMLEKYRRSGDMVGDPRDVLHTLTANDGNDFSVDTRTPGMQFTKARTLDFISDADFAQFGEKDMYKTLNSYISQATRRAEWERRMGGKRLDKLLQAAVAAGATQEQITTTENYIRAVTGTLGDTIDPTARRLMGNMVVYQNIRLLPLAIFSSVVDPIGIAVRGGTVNEAFSAFKRGVREVPRAFKKEAGPKDADTRLAELLGTIDNSTLSHALGSLYTQGMVGGTAQKLNDKFFRFNLMEGYNQSMRVAATQAAVSFIQRHAALPSAHSERWLRELGLKPADIVTHGGNIVQYGANAPLPRMALTEADGLTPAHALRIRTAINKWVDGAVLRPDSADKPIWMNDPRFMLISHLKQFTYSFHNTIIKRVIHEAENGNYSPAYAMLSYVPVMIAADYMKGFVQGGGEQPAWKKDWTASDYVASGIQRAGLLGVGQFGMDAAIDVGRGGVGIGALTGPTIEQTVDALAMAGSNARFGSFLIDAMPANALYKGAVGGREGVGE